VLLAELNEDELAEILELAVAQAGESDAG